MKKTAFILMMITILSKVFGFVRDITLSYFYGTTNISDAYLISQTIPTAIFGFIGAGITTGYIPMYTSIEKMKGSEEGNRYTNNLIHILIVLCTVIVVFGFIFTEPLVKLFASGFEGETLQMAVRFTKINLVGIYFTGLISVFTGFLQFKGNYVVPALIGFPMNIFVIVSIYLSTYRDINVLVIGTVLGTIFQFLLLYPFARKKGYRYRWIFDIKDPYIVKMAYIALPIIIGVSVNQINVLVDRTLASSIIEGGITALDYASKLNGFIQGIFVLSISTAMYPLISRMGAERNTDGFKKTVSEAISIVNLLVIPATIGAMVFAKPIVILLFNRGAFDAKAIELTSEALFFYSVGMVGFGLRDVLSRAFYSLQDTKTPAINAGIAMIINVILNIILSRFLGIGGLAFATSISAIICTVLLFISLRKKVGAFGMKAITISFVKITSASLLMGVVARFSFLFLTPYLRPNGALLISVGIGVIIYFIMIYWLKVDEIKKMIQLLKEKVISRYQ